jgi:hypothetical protein
MTRNPLLSFLIFPAITLFLVPGCTKEDTYPVTPEITFGSLEKLANLSGKDSLVLTFGFTDGDGDIGTPKHDTLNRDVFLTMYELRNGTYVKYDDPFGVFNYRIPFMVPRGNNESLKGDIVIAVDYNIFQSNDTIYYDLYMKDRAGHVSNTISTSSIVTNVQ